MNEQGTAAWRKERLNRVTASRLADVMAGPRSAAYLSYARQLRMEAHLLVRLDAGETIDLAPDFYSAATAWGKRHEPTARAEYEWRNDVDVHVPGLIVHAELPFVAASLDGMTTYSGPLVVSQEIKCPFNPAVHAATLVHGMSDEHRPQVQGGIWIAQTDAADFISFDPRRQDAGRFFQQRIERDDAYIAALDKAVREFWAFVRSGEDAPAISDSVPILF